MDPRLRGDHLTFTPSRSRTSPYRLMLWLALILGGLALLLQYQRGQMEPLLQPAPTATRTAMSYVEEARALFEAGKLQSEQGEISAIEAYQEALRLSPQDPLLWAELARVQTYSSALLSTDKARLARMDEALDSIQKAYELAPDNSTVLAIYALILDWKATNPLTDGQAREALLVEAISKAQRARDLDPQNTLALVYLAEVQLDRQDWIAAQDTIELALDLDPTSMDAHRVYATVLETLGQYRRSIEEYNQAARINPNLTFLYIRVGYTYRHLQVYDKALEFFDRAAKINAQIGVNDPAPYVGIAKTYAQQGQFFIAARNAEKALSFDPTNADTYGQLGVIYIKSRNFEGALPVLKCAVEGCLAEENEIGEVDVEGLPLTSTTLEYYLRYGSVLAALSRPGQNYCPKALEIMDLVSQKFTDPTTSSVIQENRVICSQVGASS